MRTEPAGLEQVQHQQRRRHPPPRPRRHHRHVRQGRQERCARAAINAQLDVKLAPTGSATTALKLGDADLRVNLLDSSDDTITEEDLTAAASKGISLQLDSLSKLLVTLPIPSLEVIQLENVSVGGAKGYILVSGRIH